MVDPFAAALPHFRRVLGETVAYDGGGLPEPTNLVVIWSDVAGNEFQGPGNTTRAVSFEIDRSLLTQRPAKSDRITRKGVKWAPIEVTDRDDVNAWVVYVERAE